MTDVVTQSIKIDWRVRIVGATVSGARRALRTRDSLVVKLKISGAFPPCPSFGNTVMHVRRCNFTCSRADWCKMQCFWLVIGRCYCAELFRSFSPSAHAGDAVGHDFRSTCFGINFSLSHDYYVVYRIFSNLIRTSFCRFLKRKKKLVRGSNPQLLRKSRGGCRLHGKPSRRALSSDLSRSVA